MFFPYFLTLSGFIASNCPQGTQPSLSNPNVCYYFGIQPLQYMNAEHQCQILNGHLTKIHNIQEDIFLSQNAGLNFTNASVKDFWFGANKMTGKWEWINGTNLNFTFWNISEPSNQKEQICGAVSTENGKWSAQDCFKFKPYICEIFVKETKPPTTRTTTIVSTTSSSPDLPKPCSNELTTTCHYGIFSYLSNPSCDIYEEDIFHSRKICHFFLTFFSSFVVFITILNYFK